MARYPDPIRRNSPITVRVSLSATELIANRDADQLDALIEEKLREARARLRQWLGREKGEGAG